MSGDVWLSETYFDQLRVDCFSETSERKEYEGVLRVLHDIPFYWTIWLDENRAGDALSYRQNDFLGYQMDLDRLDQHWLNEWAQQSPSVLEVMVGMARRWHFYFEESIPFYFAHMFLNMGFDRYPGRRLSRASQEEINAKCDIWLSRQFDHDGKGSPFPLKRLVSVNANGDAVSMRDLDIWAQMSAYSLENFQ